MLRPSSSNPELPPMLRQSYGSPSSKYTQDRDSVLGRARLSPSSSASPARSSLASPARSSLASPVRSSLASPVRSSLAERGRHGSFSQLSTGQIVFERMGPFQAATLLLTCRCTYSLVSSRIYIPTPTCSFSYRRLLTLLLVTTHLLLSCIYSDLLAQPVLQDAMLRLIVQQLVHHIPGHAHGKEVYLPGEVLGLLVVLVVTAAVIAEAVRIDRAV